MAKELSENKMNNFTFSSSAKDQPKVAYSETKIKVLITDIEKRLDKNQQDYWIIRTQLDETKVHNYLAFSMDYNLSEKTAYLLMNPAEAINKLAWLTIKKKDNFEKVIEIKLEK